MQSRMSLSSLGRNGLTVMPKGHSAPRSARTSSVSNRKSATPEESPDASLHVVPSPFVLNDQEPADDPEPATADPLAEILDDFQADFDTLVPGALPAFLAKNLVSEACLA